MLEKLRDVVKHTPIKPDAIMRIDRDNDDAIIHTAYSNAFILRSECKGLFSGQPGNKKTVLGFNDLGLLKDILSCAESAEFCDSATGLPYLKITSEHSVHQYAAIHSVIAEKLPHMYSLPALTPELILGSPKDKVIESFLKDISSYQTHIKDLSGVVLSTVDNNLTFKLQGGSVCKGILKSDFVSISPANIAVPNILNALKAASQSDEVVIYIILKGYMVIEAVSPFATYHYYIGGGHA